jgi:hypothetical protein
MQLVGAPDHSPLSKAKARNWLSYITSHDTVFNYSQEQLYVIKQMMNSTKNIPSLNKHRGLLKVDKY